MSTTPISNAGSVYGDFAALEKLKGSAREQDPSALRQVAQQFESLFARMMIKSMRKAIGTDPIFGSDQAQMYQGMFDDQLSLELTRGRGLGLAEMLMRQLRGSSAAKASEPAPTTAGAASPAAAADPTHTSTPASPEERSHFVRALWSQAEQAGRQLGVQPQSLIAQAALESNWGRSVPRTSAGSSSHNLFGIKASGDWRGDVAPARTREFSNGAAAPVQGNFRGYGSVDDAFRDYVGLLRDNPRYRDALHTGNDVEAFAAGLQRGGYATDPDYARKVTAVAREVSGLASGSRTQEPVKFADALPITPGTAAL